MPPAEGRLERLERLLRRPTPAPERRDPAEIEAELRAEIELMLAGAPVPRRPAQPWTRSRESMVAAILEEIERHA